MSYSNESTGEGIWPTSTRLPGYDQGQTTESEYPDPSLLHTRSTPSPYMPQGFYNGSTSSSYIQPGSYNGSTSSGYLQQGTEAFDDEDLRWPIQSGELNQRFADLDPAPYPESNWMSGIWEDLFDGQPSAGPIQQTPWGNHYNTPSSPQTNIPEPNTNNLASEGIYIPDGRAVEQDDPIVPQPAPRGRGQSATQSQSSEHKKRRSLRSRPSRSRPSSAASTAAARKGGDLSKLGQRRAALGGKWGNDRREKAPVQRVDGELYGWVDGQWERAGYHCDFREKLIRMDAQQPGAPAFPEGNSVNYTSYSPVTRDWTADPASVTDSKGRHVHFLPARPADLQYDPACGYLKCEGLVMLDHNDRPVKAYPGVPRTLCTDAPGWLLEGLRRVFGMSYPDQLARMSPEYQLRGGRTRPLFGTTGLSNRTRTFRLEHKQLGVVPWFDREKGKRRPD